MRKNPPKYPIPAHVAGILVIGFKVTERTLVHLPLHVELENVIRFVLFSAANITQFAGNRNRHNEIGGPEIRRCFFKPILTVLCILRTIISYGEKFYLPKIAN